MRSLTSVSIACGEHAGDAATMRTTLETALEFGLRVGAHPSYPDREGFGRVSMSLPADALRGSLEEQVGRLLQAAAAAGTEVSYIKPHGALYNDIAADPDLLALLLDLSLRSGLPLMLLARTTSRLTLRRVTVAQGSPGTSAGERSVVSLDGIEIFTGPVTERPLSPPIGEGFIDRAYAPDGLLVPRPRPGALIADPAEACAQALRLAAEVDSLCIHSDSPSAPELLRAARRALEEAGMEIGF